MTNEQQVFSKAYLGLKAQGFEKSYSFSRCLYRGPDNLKCAIGHVIPDDKYRPELETRCLDEVAALVPEMAACSLDFLHELQNAHDMSSSAQMMKRRLTNFAHRHGLTVPVKA